MRPRETERKKEWKEWEGKPGEIGLFLSKVNLILKFRVNASLDGFSHFRGEFAPLFRGVDNQTQHLLVSFGQFRFGTVNKKQKREKESIKRVSEKQINCRKGVVSFGERSVRWNLALENDAVFTQILAKKVVHIIERLSLGQHATLLHGCLEAVDKISTAAQDLKNKKKKKKGVLSYFVFLRVLLCLAHRRPQSIARPP
jgi:hypothetical protein